jgi:hypothetical protein
MKNELHISKICVKNTKKTLRINKRKNIQLRFYEVRFVLTLLYLHAKPGLLQYSAREIQFLGEVKGSTK